jgi:hypothetical protein
LGMDLSTTGGVEWEPGAYEGYLFKLEKRFKKFTTVNEETGVEETEDRNFVIWHLGLSEEGFENVTLTAVSSAPPWGPKSKARGWANAILRRTLGDDEKFNEDDLKDKPVMINIFMKETDRGTFAEVASLTPVRKKKSGKTNNKREEKKDLTEAELQEMEEVFDAVADEPQQEAS